MCIRDRVNMNYHAKSGASSFKIERVMISFVIWRPFCLPPSKVSKLKSTHLLNYQHHIKILLNGAKHSALYVGSSQARHGTATKTKFTITDSFFELQAPDFAWYFLLTFCKLHILENKMAAKNKMSAKSQN